MGRRYVSAADSEEAMYSSQGETDTKSVLHFPYINRLFVLNSLGMGVGPLSV